MDLKPLFQQQNVPVRIDERGTYRVGQTRVLFEIVIGLFSRGETCEMIQENFPTLELADVFLCAAFYLKNKETCDQFLANERAEADRMRKEHEAIYPPKITGEMLRARLAAKQALAA